MKAKEKTFIFETYVQSSIKQRKTKNEEKKNPFMQTKQQTKMKSSIFENSTFFSVEKAFSIQAK
jgi:hypothetical protein